MWMRSDEDVETLEDEQAREDDAGEVE